jgi:hypothetical protein
LFIVTLLLLLLVFIVIGLTGLISKPHTNATGPPKPYIPATGSAAPARPTAVCGTKVLDSPYSYNGTARTFTSSGTAGLPSFGAPGTDFPTMSKLMVVPAGDNSIAAGNGAYQGVNEIFYFEPGMHILNAGMYTGHDSVYIGGYTPRVGKAIINGVDGATGRDGLGGSELATSQASSGNVVNDTWEYLTIKNFTSSQNSAVMGNVNGGGFDIGDTYRYNTIGPNEYGWHGQNAAPGTGESSGGGYAINMSDNTTVQYNCLDHNAQGAFNGSGNNINISHNEISWNGLGEYPDDAGPGGSPYGCGCSGGGKLNFSVNATIDYNYVHDNYNAGIWLDFDNTGADISFNYIASNWAQGIFYEASYNANITYNTLVGNGWASDGAWPAGVRGGDCYGNVSCTLGEGPTTGAGGGNPYSAIYVANSGGNANLSTIGLPGGGSTTSRYLGHVLVKGNYLLNNFGGVKVYTDTDRYPDGINNDSACSTPLGALDQQENSLYYRQTKILQTGTDAAISGSTVTSASGTSTLCNNYDSGSQGNGSSDVASHTPDIGMAVYNVDTGTFLGNVASAASPHAFTLDRSPGNATSVHLLLSAYGGCGPADYFGGDLRERTGKPAADYWDNCIWGARNVTVTANTFIMQADQVTGCTTANGCGYMENVAFLAGVPKLVQYFDQYSAYTADATRGLDNVWTDNSYYWTGGGPGRWEFEAGTQGNGVSLAQWQRAPYGQDDGSTYSSTPKP